MFNIKKLTKAILISALLLVAIPATANASRVTQISHPKANMALTDKTLYYNRPTYGKAIFPQEGTQVKEMSIANYAHKAPLRVEPYLRTVNHKQVWYKFYKPSQNGDAVIRGWIPAKGLTKYPFKSVRKHHVTKQNHKHSVKMSSNVAYDLYLAHGAKQRMNNDIRVAKWNAKHAPKAQRQIDFRQIGKFVRQN